MSITQITREFLGLSSDTKPTNVATGSKFIELDTKKVFIFDGSSWYLNPMPVMVTDSLPTGSNIIGKVGIDSGNNGVSIVGSLANETLVETKTQANAVAGVVTFSENVACLEILNTDASNDGVFTVNGLAISVPRKATDTPGTSFKAVIGGTPGTTVTIAGATTYILNRYE